MAPYDRYLGAVTFKENDIMYGQDFYYWFGIPPGVRFAVFDAGPNLKLVAPGYGDLLGHNSYGNGALYVSKKRYGLCE